MKKKTIVNITTISCFLLFLLVSQIYDYNPGVQISANLFDFVLEMAKIIPCAFVLIGLFDVWVKREQVEKHLGEDSGIKSFLWVILLAGTTVGGLYVALPLAYTLYEKGAGKAVMFTYLGAAAICRIPMTLFEASFLGVKFTAIRYIVSLPIVIISSVLMAKFLDIPRPNNANSEQS